MDTVTAISERRLEAVAPQATASATTKALTVTATYLLSEEGRKASLLDGGDGKAVQQLSLQVPANRLHLVSVDVQGVARLKLRPRYQLDGENGVVRIDAAPTYDSPPDIEELFREAARNHQLERAYQSERQATKIKRREADQQRRVNAARAFLADPTRRAAAHPTPSPRRCVIETEEGRLFFDAETDVVPARDVPAEAHRRFHADLRARRQQNLQRRSEQLTQHEEKKRFADRWIAEHGTEDQRARQAAGVLSIDEAIEAMTDHAFAALSDRDRYVADGPSRIQEAVNRVMPGRNTSVSSADVVVTSSNAETMTASQWAAVNTIRRIVPDATVVVRLHNVSWKRDRAISVGPYVGILVTQSYGPFTLRREFAAHDEVSG
jgi:hypothetical protein